MKNRDFRDLLNEFCVAEARFLVVGGYAVSFHARPRFTKGLDIWVDSNAQNATRVWTALGPFGAPLRTLAAEDFTSADLIYQIGVPPVLVDILTSIEGLEFSPCWDRRVISDFDEVPIAYISKQDLIANKRAVGRPQDVLDVRALESS